MAVKYKCLVISVSTYVSCCHVCSLEHLVDHCQLQEAGLDVFLALLTCNVRG